MIGKRPVALVTGAARGIGLGISAWLIAEGWQVILTDIDSDRGMRVARALGEQAWFQALDVTDEQQITQCVAAVISQFGRIDALVNNAAQVMSKPIPLDRVALSDWNAVLSTNLTAPFLMARACADYLRFSKGAIVNIASTRAHQSEPDSEAYAASKGGLLALTHALAMSLAPEVRVNAVSPGWIDARDTAKQLAQPFAPKEQKWQPAGRVGSVEDVAATVGWLLSKHSAFITGQEIVVDGGVSRRMFYPE